MFTWWSNSGLDLPTIQGAAVTWITAAWVGQLDALISTTVGVDSVTTGLIDQTTGQQQQRMDSVVDLNGTVVANALPPDVAVVVSLRTALANRRGRGRFYLPQLNVGAVDADGSITAAAVTAILDAMNAAWSGYTPSGTPVVYSRVGRSITTVTSFDVGNFFDTQRRRENAVSESRTSRPMP